MPPKKKIVKKTVRKTKSKTPTVPESTPPPTETETALPTAAPEATDTAPEATNTASPDSSPKPSELVFEETLTAEPTTTEYLAEEPATTETLAAELASTETIAAKFTTTETPAAEPAAAETTQEPSETASKPKTITRVRKVVKKKIVKKRVPKASTAAKEDSEVVQEEAVALNPSVQPELENPSSDAAPVPEEETLETGKLDFGNGEDAPVEQDKGDVGDDDEGISERRRRRKTEIFIGGLDRDAKEEDLRKVFGKVGEIVEVRMIMDGQSGKNKGYAFLRYAEASQAKKAVSKFEKVEVCGKLCGASALKGNDTIFLGNIDKKWKKEDIIKLLKEIGIEKIEAVTVMADPNNADSNRGFAFLELETNKDAHNAYKKLQKKDVFGKGQNIKVAWAEPLNDPDEEEMKKVKSVYAEGIPSSWNEEKVREAFKKFGEIERVVLARNIKSSKRKDFAFVNYTTREAALSCIESFDKEEITDNGSKVNVKVSLAKPVQKGKQNVGGSKSTNKDIITVKPKAVQRDTKANISLNKGKSFKRSHTISGDKKSSTTHELLHVLREQATWKQGQVGYAGGPAMHDYTHGVQGVKRSFSALADDALRSDLRGYPRARLDSSFSVAGSSYGAMPHGMVGTSLPYYQHQGAGYAPGAIYGAPDYTSAHQMRQGAPPYGSGLYSRYQL